MQKYLLRAVTTIESAPLTLTSFVVTFSALILTRLLVENALGFFTEHTFFYYFFEFTHTFLFFLCAFLLLIPVARLAGHISFSQAVNILLFGFLIILTPPVIDTVIFHGGNFWSFYAFDSLTGLVHRYFTLFGDSPEMGITYGVRVEVVLVTLALGGYAFLKSKRLSHTIRIALIAYTILFVLGTLPSWITFILLAFQKSVLSVSSLDVASIFLAPQSIFSRHLNDFRSVLNVKMSLVYSLIAVVLVSITLVRDFPHYFFALLKNVRMPQVIYHSGLFFLGILLATQFTDTTLTLDFFHIGSVLSLLAAITSAWIASVIVNDHSDQRIDQKTNPDRPLVTGSIPIHLYATFGVLFFAASLLLSGIVSFSALLMLFVYQAIAWLYSAPPLRLKRLPIIATLLAAGAGLLILFSGFLLVAPIHDLKAFPLTLVTYLCIAYAIALPLKDFKDIAGDRADNVYTLPVLLGARRAQHMIGAITFLLFISSSFVLRSPSLFLPSLLFASLAFWSIQRGNEHPTSWFSFRRLPGIILAMTAAYGLVVIRILF